MKSWFPFAGSATTIQSLVIAVVFYAICLFVLGLVAGLLAGLPLLGWVVSLIYTLLRIYCIAGMVVAVLVFIKVV